MNAVEVAIGDIVRTHDTEGLLKEFRRFGRVIEVKHLAGLTIATIETPNGLTLTVSASRLRVVRSKEQNEMWRDAPES